MSIRLKCSTTSKITCWNYGKMATEFNFFCLNDSYLEFYSPKCCSKPSPVEGTSMRKVVKKVCAVDKYLECSCVTAVVT